MNASRIALAHRTLRRRLGFRQRDVSATAGVSRNKVQLIEAGRFERVSLAEIERSFAALGARVELRALWHGAALDRLLDEGHATLSAAVARLLARFGWLAHFEVTFAHFGDRGSFDLLCWHPASGTLLVIEIKTELGSVEGLLRPLDMKMRHAARVAAERFGWQVTSVGRVVVLPENRTARRAVARHEGVLGRSLPARSIAVRRWLARPSGPIAGLWFLSLAPQAGLARNPSAVRRVRKPKTAESRA